MNVQRAFAQKLIKQPAADVRRQVLVESCSRNVCEIKLQHSVLNASMPDSLIVDPLDFETFLIQNMNSFSDCCLHHMIEIANDDLTIKFIKPHCQTKKSSVPPLPCGIDSRICDCVEYYLSDWILIEKKNPSNKHCTISEKKLNVTLTDSHTETNQSWKDFKNVNNIQDTTFSNMKSFFYFNETLQNSWSTSACHLKNSAPDMVLSDIICKVAVENMDFINSQKREQSIGLMIFPNNDLLSSKSNKEVSCSQTYFPDFLETKCGHVLLKCLQFNLNLNIEPFFGSIALYDIQQKKKITENFYFDLNTDGIKQTFGFHHKKQDIHFVPNSCIFNITRSYTDVFFVIKIEKVFQGDINEALEPYIKDEKNTDKLKSNALYFCEYMGKYRMPFIWTAVSLKSILLGNSLETESWKQDKDSIKSCSLERKSSNKGLEQFWKKNPSDISLYRKDSLERKSLENRPCCLTKDLVDQLKSFKPITLTISSFFKQESDKLKDDDLCKILQDLRKPSSKRLKCIPGNLKLEISHFSSACKFCLLPQPNEFDSQYPGTKVHVVKEVLGFYSHEVFCPFMPFTNILYLTIKDVNFSNRQGSLRNITVKVQYRISESENYTLPIIFGKLNSSEFISEVYTALNYHNRIPDFYEEIKIKLPLCLDSSHHIFFTFYHISCHKKLGSMPIEVPVGYSWLPIYQNGILKTGEFSLPVMIDIPPMNYSLSLPQCSFQNYKWVDNHKNIFNIAISALSSIHTQDENLEQFLNLCSSIESNKLPEEINHFVVENELYVRILKLVDARPEPLIKYLPLILNKIFKLMIHPVKINDSFLNLSHFCFEGTTLLIDCIQKLVCYDNRNTILASYIYCMSKIPVLKGTEIIPSAYIFFNEVSKNIVISCSFRKFIGSSCEVLDNSASYKKFNIYYSSVEGEKPNCEKDPSLDKQSHNSSMFKIFHEELVSQWISSNLNIRDLAFSHAWFFFGLIFKSMVEFLFITGKIQFARKSRFSSGFKNDILTLISLVASIIMYNLPQKDSDLKFIQSLNTTTANFLCDLLSVMDRGFVFSLIKIYVEQISLKIDSMSDPVYLFNLKLDFLKVILNHDHSYVLNLPFGSPLTNLLENLFQNQDILHLKFTERHQNFTFLSNDFLSHHFLIGLLLSTSSTVLNMKYNVLHESAVDLLFNTLRSCDFDLQFSTAAFKARIALLYIPLIRIVLDILPHLYYWNGPFSCSSSHNDHFHVSPSIIMAIAGVSMFGIQVEQTFAEQVDAKYKFSADLTRKLLLCFHWVLKNVNNNILLLWWKELSTQQLNQLLDVLYISISCFKYMEVTESKNILPFSDKNFNANFKNDSPNEKEFMDVKNIEPSNELYVDMNLSHEINMNILNCLELLTKVILSSDHLNYLMTTLFKILLHSLICHQNSLYLQNAFASLRCLIIKFSALLFDYEAELCGDMCLCLLKHCASSLVSVRSQASATLFLLMKQNFEIGNNFAKVKMQVTMSLSSLAGMSKNFNDEYLRRSLKTILIYAEEDSDFQVTTFPEQVKNLVFNLHMILSDTIKMKEYHEDPEMLIDLMYRIAKGYQNSPDLRLTWLSSIAEKHIEKNNYIEAAMCFIHSAALVSEYMHMLEDSKHLPIGAIAFSIISPNVLQESAVSEDILNPEDAVIYIGKYFTEDGLVCLLESAINYLYNADMYELINEIYKVIIPIASYNHDFEKLACIHCKLYNIFEKINHLDGKRIFGTYFRIGFYGSKFGDLNKEEFIYKEPMLTKLSEISDRLEDFYTKKFGISSVQLIKDSNPVDPKKLNPCLAYIQITYVEPYFESWELDERSTLFEKNHNLRHFLYSTPFTKDGRAHGDLNEQFKRKTILTTAYSFPYIKTRIPVIKKQLQILTPIEVAIEDIQKKIGELQLAIEQNPPDPKILQMVLQGCIGTTVNQGPLEMALVFLKNENLGKYENKLRLCFKDFSRKCSEALQKNEVLIGSDQLEYQKELERNYHLFVEQLMPLISKMHKFKNVK